MPGDTAVEFDVLHDTAGAKDAPWVVIYRRGGKAWGRYQSHVVNEATARKIADALQLAETALQLAETDPEAPDAR